MDRVIRVVPFLLAAFAFSLTAPAAAVVHDVTVANNFFSPATVTIAPGDTVRWTNTGINHNVAADDGSFRCANGCDSTGGDGDPASNDWQFSLTFDDPGETPYHCEVHGAPGGIGMSGTVIVEEAQQEEPGTLSFTTGAVSVAESAGGVMLTVQRTGGSDGQVGVSATTADGTAIAGQDYGAVEVDLSWNDGDSSDRSVMIPILGDAEVEGSESFTVGLGSPTGGAGLGNPGGVTVTIVDDDEDDGDDGDGDGDDGGDDGDGDAGEISFAAGGSPVLEGRTVGLSVVRRNGTEGTVGASWDVTGGSAAGEVEADSGTIELAAGSEKTTIDLRLSDDGDVEPVETVEVTLSDPTGGAALGAIQRSTVVVFDDDEVQQTLGATEVLCDGVRLREALARLESNIPNAVGLNGVALSLTERGDFAGVAFSPNDPASPEHQLTFSSNPEETTLLRNPERPQLSTISLTRNQTSSDLVPEGDPGELDLFLNPTLALEAPDPGAVLRIDDVGDPLERTGGTPAESKPGRGLADIVRPCHDRHSRRDVHVFRVLTKIARATAPAATSMEIAIFRGEDPDTYRLDVYPTDENGPMGRLAVELEVGFTPAGALRDGTLRVLGDCTPTQAEGCTSVTGQVELQLVRPTTAGEPWTDSSSFVGSQGPAESAVDFEDLLGGSTWSRAID